jgi:hypothetical protein
MPVYNYTTLEDPLAIKFDTNVTKTRIVFHAIEWHDAGPQAAGQALILTGVIWPI